MSAPAARAFSAFSPWANTATRTVLPIPCGSETDPRTFWSVCFGSIPRWVETSTVWLNFVVLNVFKSRTASGSGTGPFDLTLACKARYRFDCFAIRSAPFESCRLVIGPRWAVAAGGSPSRRPGLASRPDRVDLVRPAMARRRSALDIDPHAPRGAGDDPAGVIQVAGVQVGELGLGDLLTCSAVTVATLVLCGSAEPEAIPAACFSRTAAGGLLVMNSNVRSE